MRSHVAWAGFAAIVLYVAIWCYLLVVPAVPEPEDNGCEPTAYCTELIKLGNVRRFECVYKDGTHFIHALGDSP